MIRSVGYVAENKTDFVTLLRKMGAEGVRQEDSHAILNDLCALSGASPSFPVLQSQIYLGLQLPETRAVAGEKYCDWMIDPLVRHLHQIRKESGAVDMEKHTANYGRLLAAAENTEAAAEIVYDGLDINFVKALDIRAEKVDAKKSLHGMGVDSLVAV